MIKPLKNWYITSPYGNRIHPTTGEYKMHYGIDLRAPIGTPIYSPESGVVVDAGTYTAGGKELLIQHNNNYKTSYSHLSSFAKNSGDLVIKGELIGYTGSTGNITGPHLHYGVRFNGDRIDPETVIYEDAYNIIGNYDFNNGLQPNFKKYAIWILILMGFSLTYILYKRKYG